MVILSPETEARLQMIASRRGLSPEQTLDQMLAKVQADDEAAAVSQPPRPAQAEPSPTMTLFRRWAAEDATEDPEEIARRRREGDETQARLAESRFSLRGRTNLQEADNEGPLGEAAA